MSERVVALLRERGAEEIQHPGGDLLAHLVRTAALLEAWDASTPLVGAGLMHAAYGTDGFDVALFGLDERAVVVDAIGEEAASLVYLYASCDRAFAYPQIGHGEPVAFRDRFTGRIDVVDAGRLRQFAELTFANELDLVRHSETVAGDLGPALAALFGPWQDVVSGAAYDEYRRLLKRRARAPR